MTDPASYTVSVVSAQAPKGRKVPVASLTLDTLLGATIGPAPSVAYPPATVTGTLGTGGSLITGRGNGSYIFTIHSAGIISLSGAALDGEYTGKYPTGNGVSGGDFQVKINVRNGKASGPIRVTPIKARHHA